MFILIYDDNLCDCIKEVNFGVFLSCYLENIGVKCKLRAAIYLPREMLNHKPKMYSLSINHRKTAVGHNRRQNYVHHNDAVSHRYEKIHIRT